MLIFILLIAAASSERWYYPDETNRRVTLDDRLALTEHILIRPTAVGMIPPHPDVVETTWLTRQPPVAKLTLRSQADPIRVSQELHDTRGVVWAHPDFRVPITLHQLPDDPYVENQWHLENDGQSGNPGVDIDAEGAWALSTGAGSLIAVIDSGVDMAHPDLLVTSGTDYVGGDEDSTPIDDEAHGTACAGLAAGVGNNQIGIAGVAYDAEVYGIRLLGDGTTSSDTYSALIEAVDAGADVISNSWGYSISCDGFTLSSSFKNALEYAEEEGRGGLGTVVVQAAGNSNCDISNDGILAHETVVAVAAIGATDEQESYSSFGDPIDIAAPSGGLLTTDITGESGYGSYNDDNDYTGGMSGTSASTPLVAGVFGLMFAANDRLTAKDARDVVCLTATRNDILFAEFDDSGWSPYYGCGRVDAAAAVAMVANETPMAPTANMPSETVYEDRIWLDWNEAADADADRLTYRVQWWTDGEPTEEVVDGTSLDLTDAATDGMTLSWQVQAIDLWGEGPWSEVYSISVIGRPEATPLPEDPGGCQFIAGGSWWLAFVGLGARRRKQRRTQS